MNGGIHVGTGDNGKELVTGAQGGANQVKMEASTFACERERKPCNAVNNADGNIITVRKFWMLKVFSLAGLPQKLFTAQIFIYNEHFVFDFHRLP